MVLLPGISRLIQETNERIRRASLNDEPVFVTGEPGTEKSFAAKLIHQQSNRSVRPLAKVNVSWKLPPDLAQYFEQCGGGSLIIHLQKEFPLDMQYTLIELATDRSFADPMTGDVIEADVRMILMTSLNLEAVSDRTPLLPELKELLGKQHVEIPPLRERLEDIPALVRYAMKRAFDTGRTKAQAVDPQVLTLFRHWDWPGNAEDLLLITAQAAIASKGEVVTIEDLPETFLSQMPEEALKTARSVRSPRGGVALTPLPVEPNSRDRVPQVNDSFFERTAMLARTMPRDSASSAEVPRVPAVNAPAAAGQGTKETAAADSQGEPFEQESKRLLSLARRLHAQSALLKRQMSGPIAGGEGAVGPDIQAAHVEDPETMAALEKELDRGLDMVHMLRRQMALLNRRQSQSAETIRDLVQRISVLAGNPSSATDRFEATREAKELSEMLREIDVIMKRLSVEVPNFNQHMEKTTAPHE